MPSLLVRKSPSSPLDKIHCTFISSTDFERLAKKAIFKGVSRNVEILRTYEPCRSNTQKKTDIPEPPDDNTWISITYSSIQDSRHKRDVKYETYREGLVQACFRVISATLAMCAPANDRPAWRELFSWNVGFSCQQILFSVSRYYLAPANII